MPGLQLAYADCRSFLEKGLKSDFLFSKNRRISSEILLIVVRYSSTTIEYHLVKLIQHHQKLDAAKQKSWDSVQAIIVGFSLLLTPRAKTLLQGTAE